jgi:excisionase family DNA binding protein
VAEPDYVSVKQAAESLGLDDSRVRQLLREGRLRGAMIGSRWIVEAEAVRERNASAHTPGRPLSERNAWGILALLSGSRAPALSDPERSRLVARIRDLADCEELPAERLRKLLAARAEVRRYRAHRGLLPTLLADPDVVRTGVSAAPRVGADYVAPGRAEIYVHPDRVGKLEAGFGLVLDAHGGNLVVRVPSATAWTFLVSAEWDEREGRDAPAPVVAADLLDTREDRAVAAAAGVLRPLLTANAAKGRRAA